MELELVFHKMHNMGLPPKGTQHYKMSKYLTGFILLNLVIVDHRLVAVVIIGKI